MSVTFADRGLQSANKVVYLALPSLDQGSGTFIRHGLQQPVNTGVRNRNRGVQLPVKF
jgi:hypothetical protein